MRVVYRDKAPRVGRRRGGQGATGTGTPGGNVMAIGLLKDAATLTVPVGTDVVQTTGNEAVASGSGQYFADAAVDSAYLAAHPKAGFVDLASRGFRVGEEAPMIPQRFYEATDANFGFAMLRALDYLKSRANSGYGYGDLGASRLMVPRGSGPYLMGANTLDLDFGLVFEGDSVGGVGPGSSILKWNNGVTGIRTQYNDTTGATGTKTPVANYGLVVLRNLLLHGSYAGGSESEAYAIHARASISVEDVSIYNFAGDGVYQRNTAGGSPEGNSNVSFLKRVFVQGCRNGFYVDGADVNASTFLACNANANRQWGVWDSSFIGNTYLGCHTAANGWDGAISSVPTACTYSSKRYYVKPGQAVGASTNAPSGTTADNTWWGYIGAGGTYNGIVAWVSGTTFREGGSYKCDEASAVNQVISCYAETDQNPPQVATPSVVWGGVVGEINKGNGPTVNASGADLVLSGGILTQGQIGSFGSSVGTDHAVYTIPGSGGRYIALNYHEFFAGGVRAGYWGSGGLNLDSGKTLTVNGAQVVAARQTGTAAVATDPATTMALVNDLRAKLVTHGLIS